MKELILTVDEAEKIKDFRMTSSWREVANKADDEWPDRGYMRDDQGMGVYLCDEAAKVLGDDQNRFPWN
jgi:peptide methionine sulfoxide reductase MsrB